MYCFYSATTLLFLCCVPASVKVRHLFPTMVGSYGCSDVRYCSSFISLALTNMPTKSNLGKCGGWEEMILMGSGIVRRCGLVEGMALLEAVCHSVGGLEVSYAQAILSVTVCFLLLADQDAGLSVYSPVLCLPAHCHILP